MKKIKIFLLSLAFCSIFAAGASFAACGSNKGEGTNSEDWTSNEEQNITLQFATTSVEVNQYESLALAYTLKGTSAAVHFSSSDETAVSVDENGVVTAYGTIGSVTITATVEDVSASCTVVVQKSSYAPIIVTQSSAYTIENGSTLEFSVESEWNNIVLDEPIAYGVTLAEAYEGADASISATGNVISVTATEDVEIIIFATIRGVYTSKSIMVNVVESILKIQPITVNFTPGHGNYETQISTTSEIGDMANEVALSFVVAKGAQTYEDIEIEWTIDGDAALLVDNSLIGQKTGSVLLTGTASYQGETAVVEVVCEVIPPVAHLSETHVFEVENLTALTIESELIGTLQSVELFGETISKRIRNNKVSIDKDLMPREAKKLGMQQFTIITDKVCYTMDVEIYTLIINNADEFDQMATLADTGSTEWSTEFSAEVSSQYFDGYFILGNDIDYNKTAISMTDSQRVYNVHKKEADMSRGFRGVFDGNGYNIDGMTVGATQYNASTGLITENKNQSGGLFGYLAADGVVKNVSFTNATLLANNGFICSRGAGTIENVSISYKKIGGDKETTITNGWGYRTMGSFFSLEAEKTATVKNCLIDASVAEITWADGYDKNGIWVDDSDVHLVGKAQNVSNVIVICPIKTLLDYSGGTITRATYDEIIKEENLLRKFDSAIWTLVDGVPMFVNQANNLDRDRTISFVRTEDTLLVGFDLLLAADNPYTIFSIEETAGITLDGLTLSATEEGYGKTIVVTATSIFNPTITATHSIYVESFGAEVSAPQMDEEIVVYHTNPVLSLGDNSWMGEENYLYVGKNLVGYGVAGDNGVAIDFQKVDWGWNSITVVMVNGGVRSHFAVDVKIWYETSNISESALIEDNFFCAEAGMPTSQTTFTKVDAEESAPTGFEKVTQYNTTTAWTSALSKEYFSQTDLAAYSEIWVAFKVSNAQLKFMGKDVKTSDWVYFHFIQTSDDVWIVEVTVDGKLYTTQFDYDATGWRVSNISQLLYRSGFRTGFLIYPSGATVDEENPVSIYSTEVRGIKK